MSAREINTSIDSDYVDDSEPERKRIRLQASEVKKRRTRQKQSELQRQNTVVARSSSPSNPLPTYHHPAGGNTITLKGLDGITAEAAQDHMETAVIDAIDDTRQSCSEPPPESLSPVPPEDSRPRASRASSPQLIPSSDATGIVESPESNITTCLGHLSYCQVGPASNNASDSSKAGSSRSVSVPRVHQGKVERPTQRFQPDSSVTKPDIGPLLRCVSCEVQWTVQKSAARKSSHMTTCARRKGINPSTLQLLVERELLKLQRQKANDQNPPCSAPADAAPQTYMESVVAEAQPRRRQRRTDTIGTLQPVSQTRAAILDRAKVLLGTREREVAPCNAPEPEHTQSFGRSKLVTGHLQADNLDSTLAHSSEECAVTSRLALLRSMAESSTA